MSGAAASACRLSAIAGGLVAAIGVLGFVPGVTQHLGALGFAGHGSQAMLFGTFRVSVVENAVHLAIGAAGLAASRAAATAVRFLRWGGVAMLLLWLSGAVGVARVLPANLADNYLHFGLGVALLAAFALVAQAPASPATPL